MRSGTSYAPPDPSVVADALSWISSGLLRGGGKREKGWANVLMGIKSALGDTPEAESIARQWSETADSYDPRDFSSTWNSISADGGIGAGTLFKIAKENGWPGPCRQADPDLHARMDQAVRTNGNGHSRTVAAPSADPSDSGKSESKGKLWRLPDEALVAFEKLILARCDPAARRLFQAEYGLDPESLPDTWRVLELPGRGLGVAYRGQSPDGALVIKWKSLARNAKGKRDCLFLFGAGGALVLRTDPTRPWACVAGEEKSLAFWQAGFNVLAPLTGEKALAPEWAAWLAAQGPCRVVFANDNDKPGADANAGGAGAAEVAGIQADRIFIVQWPTDAPAGFDVNDTLKAGGLDAVRELVENAAGWTPTVNQAPSMADFLSAPRPALAYHISGVLPERGKMTISAVAKGFKTTLLIELGLCASAGHVQYLNFEFGDPARVLLVQPELSDGLLSERLFWIIRTAPDWIDRNRVMQNFHVMETACGRPSLWHAHPRGATSRREVEAAIARTGAKILLVDSLYMTFAGMDENAADQMTLALDYLGELANRYGVAIILSHHFNKSGTAARGSSVYQGWGETDLSISTLEKDTSVVKVEALMRCAFPKGFPAYWRKPDEATAWFELMPEDWAPEKPGRKSKASSQLVVMVLRESGTAMKYKDLVQAISDACGCGRSAATEAIADAVEKGVVFKGAGNYALPHTSTVR